MTSGWFSLESTVITLAITAAAFSFYRDRTTQKARKMFHASLLYLPVFMSGLLLHRRTIDNQECLVEDNPKIIELSSSSESEKYDRKSNKKARAPVAYASVAPFPFLPAPCYVADS